MEESGVRWNATRYSDNYTDESFLERMVMNANVVKRDMLKRFLHELGDGLPPQKYRDSLPHHDLNAAIFLLESLGIEVEGNESSVEEKGSSLAFFSR
ncbi:hypothetical protein Sjap_020673 [Stephania japonica]|uniref:Uncharacterized protein n=1 Tax=Stephania japonica TaxID=461633 RepID=A0AAP0FA29_9MAGN